MPIRERLGNQDELQREAEAEPGSFPRVSTTSDITAHLCACGNVPKQRKNTIQNDKCKCSDLEEAEELDSGRKRD